MNPDDGLIFAYLLDRHGGGRELDWSQIRSWRPDQGILWVHLDRTGAESRRWLSEDANLDPLASAALLAEETRPRVTTLRDGLVVTLRGVNLNPGADPEDMVSLRLWLEPDRIVSARQRHLMAVEDIRANVSAGTGPTSTADFLAEVAERLVERMGPVVTQLDDEVDDLEDQMLTVQSSELRSTIAELRRQAITLRRYLAPQREALARLLTEPASWIGEAHRLHLREVADRITRYVEDLDAARERAAVTHEELSSRLSEQMNRIMYVLSLVAAIFLPLGLLTGLLGINVGGIPWAESRWGFEIVTCILIAIAIALLIFFRRRHLF